MCWEVEWVVRHYLYKVDIHSIRVCVSVCLCVCVYVYVCLITHLSREED